ncbi:MAG: enoyl-CoA hydratase-related protein [Chloroflexota bacterium]|nr:enoyl-CoA hydratase-related protein [Chloroflexota bacterium]
MATAGNELLLEKKEGILTITMNRPERLNALTDPMREALVRAFTEAVTDKDTRVLIVTGAGRGFCSGADVGGMRSGEAEPATGVRRIGLGWPIAVAMRDLGKPIIAAVNGVAVGAGLGLAMNSDIRIASDKAQFGTIFVRRALATEWGLSYLLPRIIGPGKTLEIALTGDIIDARQAEQLGLVNKVVPHDDLMKAARELALKLAKGPALSYHLIKKAVYAGMESSFMAQLTTEASATTLALQSDDNKEAVAAFLEKREPKFQGR